MNPDFLIDGVLRSVMGGGRKTSSRALRYLNGGGSFWSNPSTLLTAAGLAWGVYDTLQNQTGQSGDTGQWGGGFAPAQPSVQTVASNPGTAAGAVPLPPLPNAGTPAAAASVDEASIRLVRLAISAATADGVMSDRERAAVVEQAKTAGVGDVVERELQQRRPLAAIVDGVTDPAQRATLYVLAFTILRADEQLTGAERIYLAQLAHLLGLDPQTVTKLETDTSQRIDRLAEQSPAANDGPAPEAPRVSS